MKHYIMPVSREECSHVSYLKIWYFWLSCTFLRYGKTGYLQANPVVTVKTWLCNPNLYILRSPTGSVPEAKDNLPPPMWITCVSHLSLCQSAEVLAQLICLEKLVFLLQSMLIAQEKNGKKSPINQPKCWGQNGTGDRAVMHTHHMCHVV